MHFYKQILVVLGTMLALSAHAFDPFVVKDIRVEGIQRTEPGTVFSYLPVKVGDTMDDDKAAQAIRSLFATGFFQDVSLEADNGVLIVTVQERPSVSQIQINGAKAFKKEDLLKGLSAIGLTEGRIFDRGLLDKAQQELKRQYINGGRYSAQVTTTATPLERNRVAVRIDIVEGDVAKIRQISIIGNKVFPEKELLSLFKLGTPGIMSWFTDNDQYSREKLGADLETLRSYYLDRGYLEFNVESTQVSITPDKKDVYLTVGITEGPQFTVSEIKVAGETLIPADEALKLVKLKAGDIFSRAKLTESTKAISDRLGNDGYAFANVNAVPDVDRDKRRVAFTFFVDPGRRVYVRRINVSGNTRTRDEVIRREMRQLEGGWYSADKITKSKQRIDRLGYFESVNVETPSVAGTTDQVDVNIDVKEKPTGNIMLGAGYGQSEGVILSTSISQQNVFGTGNFLGLQMNTSKLNRVISLSFTQPYWTVDGVSRGFDIYKRNLDPNALSVGEYSTSTLGVQMRFGVPVTDVDTVLFGLGFESTSITTYDDSPLNIINYVNVFGTQNTAILGTLGWSRDSRDSAIYTTSGGSQRINVETGLPGGTLQFYKLEYQNKRYFPLTSNYTLYVAGDVGYGGGLQGKPLPFFRNYYTGGVNSVRGFRSSTIGPKDENGTPIGGSKELVGNTELLFPFPFMKNDRSWRASVFVDAGLVGDSYSFSSLGASAGMAVSWVSPMGPLKISLAQPWRAPQNDTIERFQFQFGTRTRSNGSIGANLNVVCNLDLVVQLHPIFDDGIVKRTAVYRCVGANFDVIANQRPSDLGDLPPYAFLTGDAKPVGAYHYAGMHDAACADPAFVINGYIGVKSRSCTYYHAIADVTSWANDCMCGNVCTFADDGAGGDTRRLCDVRRSIHYRGFVSARFDRGGRIKQFGNFGEIKVRISADDARQSTLIACLGAQYHCGGPSLFKLG